MAGVALTTSGVEVARVVMVAEPEATPVATVPETRTTLELLLENGSAQAVTSTPLSVCTESVTLAYTYRSADSYAEQPSGRSVARVASTVVLSGTYTVRLYAVEKPP